jgi:predicted glycosyltransferase
MNRYYDPMWVSRPDVDDPYSLQVIFDEINRDYRYYGIVQRQPLMGLNYNLGHK